MRLVFLDIDGVLLPYPLEEDRPRVCKALLPETNGCPMFAEECVAELNWLCDKGNASIVVSSSWRQHIPCLETMRAILREQGVSAPFTGVTPIAEGEWERHDRGDEVAFYMKSLDVESFVILDDTDMGWTGLETYWVQPVGNLGLRREDAEIALEILNSGPQLTNA